MDESSSLCWKSSSLREDERSSSGHTGLDLCCVSHCRWPDVASGRRHRGGPEGREGWMRSSPGREGRQAHSTQTQQSVQRQREWKGVWHVPAILQGSLEGWTVLGDKAVGQAASLGGARDSALRSLSSVLPGPRSHLRCLPAERSPSELCFQKTTVWRVNPGERRGEPLERDAKSPSQATAAGSQEGTERFLPWSKRTIGTMAPGPGHLGFNPNIIH